MQKLISVLICIVMVIVGQIVPLNVYADDDSETKRTNTIAVLDLEAKSGVTKDTTSMMTEVLRDLIMKSGKYRLLARDKMEEVLKEQNFSVSGRCTTECQLKIGEILVVKYLVAGTVGKLGKTYIISVQLIDVEKGEVVKSALEKAESEDVFDVTLDKISKAIFETSEVVVVQEKKGNIQISSTPSDAEIFINDKLMDTTPTTIRDLLEGSYNLALKKQGYKDVLKNINIQAGTTITESINLEKILLTGSLEIKSDPEGAKVVINGKEKGVTPLTLNDIETGTYRITILKDGYKENKKDADVKFNKTTTENFTLEKAEAGGGAGWVLWVALGTVVIISGVALALSVKPSIQQTQQSNQSVNINQPAPNKNVGVGW